MRMHNILEEVLGQRSKIKILRVLFKSKIEITGRQVAQLSGLNHRTCHLALRELIDEGIVSRQKVGKAHLFSLKETNYLVSHVLQPLFKKEAGLLQTALKKITKSLDRVVVSLVLFGSFVQGREKSDSDIDLLVLVSCQSEKKKVERRFDSLNMELTDTFGNVVSPYILTLGEFTKKHRAGERLIEKIIKEGKVIQGKSLSEVLTVGSQED